MRAPLVLGLALALTAPAFAQQSGQKPAETPSPMCYVQDKDLPPGLEDWKGTTTIATATGVEHLSHSSLKLGTGYVASLLNTPKVAMPVQPEKPGGSVAHAGLFSFNIETEGLYTVALSTAAWIDVLEDGKSLEPKSFGHGPKCTSIRKMVVFPMKPGVHTLQISANAESQMKIMVAKQP